MFQHLKFFRLSVFALFLLSNSFLLAQITVDIDSLKQILFASKTDSTTTKLLYEIGREYWFARNFTEAAEYLHRSVALAKKTGHKIYLADTHHLLGNLYMKKESFDSSFSQLQKAMEQNDEKFFPQIYETYCKLYYQLGDYQTSLQYAMQSVDAYEKSTDTLFNMQSVFPYLMIGDIFIKLRQDERAYDYFMKAYRKAKLSKTSFYIKTPIQRIASYHLSKNALEQARHLYDTILIVDEDSPNHEATMYSYEGLGDIAAREGNFKNAIEYYKKALQYALQKGLNINIENFYTQLGGAFLKHHQTDSAQYYLTRAIALSTRSKNYYNLLAAYNYLSLVQQQQKKFPEALHSFQLHKTYQDSILSVEKVRTVNNLEVLYRTRQKENEILRLQQAEQEKDFAIKKRNIYISIGMGLVTAMAIILLLLRRNYHNKQHLQEEKVKQMERQQQVISLQSMINGQEAERTRMAKDLHDGLGGLFSTVKMYFSTLEHEHVVLKSNDLFKKSYTLVDSASLEIRRIAHNMMPEVLMKLGLINAVKDLCDNISAGRLLNVSLEVHGMKQRFNTDTEVMLYRIIQELLNNIVKHAQATEAIIQFIKDDNRFSVVVEDNGKGFEIQETDGKVHTGLSTIKSRVSYLNGKFTIDSQKNLGTTVMMDFLVNETWNSVIIEKS